MLPEEPRSAGATPLTPDVAGTPGAGADAALAAACQGGSLPAFERLYHTHGAKMKSIAYNLLGNATDAEDAVQETFLKVYRSIGGFKGQSSLATWVTRILINNCYDLRRKRSRRQEVQELENEEGQPLAEPAARGDERLRVVLRSCIAQLRERERTVFTLFEVEGFSHAEIAGMLDISEASSKNTLFLAKRELRRMLLDARGVGTSEGKARP